MTHQSVEVVWAGRAGVDLVIRDLGLLAQITAECLRAVGIDGYIDEINKKMVFFYNENDTPDDREVASVRYEMFVEELNRVNRFLQENSIPFSILTPTSHKKYYRNYLGK
jgi:hypothetical protein